MQDSFVDKVKNYIFPAKKVLDKAAAQGGNVSTGMNTTSPGADPLYLQKIVNERMKEKMTKKNPLEEALKKKSTKK